MITKQEITAVELSPTKKDFYQMWNELVDLVDKLSAIWKVRATNESDPGVVLLKALVGVADKLNNSIDMNTREDYMPSATQIESMRKLCDMMGYMVKHYIAATGEAVIAFKDTETITLADISESGGVYIPRFTNLQNTDESVNYVTLEGIRLYSSEPSRKVPIIEGQLVECESNNDNIISISQLDDNQRFFLPEKNVAENGIFILNVDDNIEDTSWRKVDNLNTVPLGNKVYKFGYDSMLDLPYIQFPDDIGQLIEDGLRINYIRTNGQMGNIALKTLSKIVPPALWQTSDNELISGLTADNFAVTNNSEIVNGANPEDVESAYNNYKKTIGTFDTLVACKDYMNKIYQLTKSTVNTTPLVSNIIVSDIRDDINRSHLLCSMNDYGICYLNEADKVGDTGEIDHFDLVFYPFKTVVGTGTKNEYDNSFTYTTENATTIEQDINNIKSISHNIIYPKDKDIACIKNYLRLKAKITTTTRVGASEEKEILNRIYTNIFVNFNMRKIDFGEEIPVEQIEKVIFEADSRIKDVNLDDPIITTKIMTADNVEYDITGTTVIGGKTGKYFYQDLIVKNILAGRISAFKYNTDFEPSFAESKLTQKSSTTILPTTLPTVTSGKTDHVKSIELKLNIDTTSIADPTTSNKPIVLDSNEVIQFKAPNFRTTITYPAYVNYYFETTTGKSTTKPAIPATFMSLATYLVNHNPTGAVGYNNWFAFGNSAIGKDFFARAEAESLTLEEFKNITANYGCVYKKVSNEYQVVDLEHFDAELTYYVARIAEPDESKAKAFKAFNDWLKGQTYHTSNADHQGISLLSLGLCRNLGQATLSTVNIIGKMVDADGYKYASCIRAKAAMKEYYVQETWTTTSPETENPEHTADGLGRSAEYHGVPKDGEYQLQTGDVLYINYTKTSDDGNETKTVINKVYEGGKSDDPIVIKANFELINSSEYHSSHSYSKKDGYNFNKTLEGMFTLTSDQQIEIREQVKVVLNETLSKIYWFLNTDSTVADSTSYFCGDEKSPFGKTGRSYTLQEGEYLFYTNAKETDYNYYGSGTTIELGSATPMISRTVNADDPTLADILTYGLDAEIPWITVNLASDTKKITVVENQFLSLTEGDSLSQITISETGVNSLSSDKWTNVSAATYKLAGSDTETELPELAVTGLSWQARSKLDFKSGPSTTQKIETTYYNGNKIKETSLVIKTEENTSGYTYTADTFKLTPEQIDSTDEKLTQQSFVFRTNYNLQSAMNKIDVEQLIKNYEELLDTYTTTDNIITEFKVRLHGMTIPKAENHAIISLDNFGENYTKYSFTTNTWFKLHINIPATGTAATVDKEKNCGLMAFYYLPGVAGNTLKIETFTGETQTANGIWKYNQTETTTASNTSDTSDTSETVTETETETVTDDPSSYRILSSKGLVVLGIAPAVDTIKITGTAKDVLIFSDLSIVEDINPKLAYIDNLTSLLTAIKAYDPNNKFLYNIVPNKTTAIDLNNLISEETMQTSSAFYDKNNIANKFVISEIDSNELRAGITLTKSSKL